MPKNQSRRIVNLKQNGSCGSIISVALMVGAIALPVWPAWAASDAPTAVRSREVELHYRLDDPDPKTEVELFYTRDRGATWKRYDGEKGNPIRFVAPAEGLYGFIVKVRDARQATTVNPPARSERPQRWIFVDYTPPLVQWDGVEPVDTVNTSQIVQLRWTAYDDNLPSRPVSLAYQSSVEQAWQTIDAALPNVGRYDWRVPPTLRGQITLKLSVRDLGEHVVERLYGPVPIERWWSLSRLATTHPSQVKHVATQPASIASDSRHAGGFLDIEQNRKADELYQQGVWNLERGQYAVAAERFREALESDPEMLAAMSGLAGIYNTQKDYAKALELYQKVLARDSGHTAALRGAALAYVGRKEYTQSRDALKKMLAANGKDAEGWLDLGDVLFMMGDRDQARSHWDRAATADQTAEDIIRKARQRMELYGSGKPANGTGVAANQ